MPKSVKMFTIVGTILMVLAIVLSRVCYCYINDSNILETMMLIGLINYALAFINLVVLELLKHK